ncbi:hypothetical protein SERLA73DRAFT_126277 [Serpula lacrymans var. lacrymans S7.3]|uniref:Uncharacterized protein n=1 Tax=Serpula lacrymans var. lacrymans (strain S7.3) TaxID=936435 RepID=F8QCI8_SERL3|nr:hypothetical protein SERLA73DRAFT_126277 [Serpula lacrymans var. lacrymans S7.3]
MTGKWWHAIQAHLPKGAAPSPVIIATDKTQLTQFSDSKFAYSRPSQHACIVISYLSVIKIIGIAVRDGYHFCYNYFGPIKKAGRDGIEVIGGDGAVKRVYPVLACYVTNYPEQCLVMCSKYGTCPKYKRPPEELSASTAGEPYTDQWTESVINKAKEDTHSFHQFQERCKEQLLSGSVYKPFWTGFSHCNIHIAITSDVLHQLYQGIFKHMSTPPYFGVCYFKNGFSALGQIGGKKRKDMQRYYLTELVVGKQQEDSLRSLLDLLRFIYYYSVFVLMYCTVDESSG